MLSGIALTLVVLAVVLGLVGFAIRAWLGTNGFIAERVRVELEQRNAERQIQHIAYAAMQRLVEEARRNSPGPS